MTITQPDLKALAQKSGNRCAFPECGALLLEPGLNEQEQVILSNIAHIVGKKEDGPRGRHHLPMELRDKENNLILLCRNHHAIVDDRPQYYTVERLRQMKLDHENRIEKAAGQATKPKTKANASYVGEEVHSTLLPVVTFPQYIYGSPCKFSDRDKDDVRALLLRPRNVDELYPYVIRGGMLYAFQRLDDPNGPFARVVDRGATERFPSAEWWNDSDRSKWLVTLLNRALNKLTGRKGLQWDVEHHRFFFAPDKQGEVKEIRYRPLNQSSTTRQVVWQPIVKKTGEPSPYWLHRAVNLRFTRVGKFHWCLSIRPEFRVTKDGITPEDSDKIGGHVTRKKSRMFNYDLLGEVNFWRDYLGDSKPRIIFNFGKSQPLVVSTKMMATEVKWPGIPDAYAVAFANVEYQDDLFTLSELNLALGGDETEDFDDDAEGWTDEEEDDNAE